MFEPEHVPDGNGNCGVTTSTDASATTSGTLDASIGGGGGGGPESLPSPTGGALQAKRRRKGGSDQARWSVMRGEECNRHTARERAHFTVKSCVRAGFGCMESIIVDGMQPGGRVVDSARCARRRFHVDIRGRA